MVRLKRHWVPLLLIILLPQIVNLLCCTMLSSRQIKDIPMVVYMGDNSPIARRIVNAFDNNGTFEISAYAANPDSVTEKIDTGEAAFGLIIPKNFSKDLLRGKAPSILTVIDGSRLSAASFSKITASEILLGLKKEVLQEEMRRSFSMTGKQAENAVSGITFSDRILGNPTRDYMSFLMPGMMTAIVQVGLAMYAASSGVLRSENGIAKDIMKRIGSLTAVGFLSLMGIVTVQTLIFKVLARSGFMSIALLSLFFAGAVSATGVLISYIFSDKVLASQAAAVWFIPSTILSGYTWPQSAMPGVLRGLGWLMPFTHYGDALRSLMLKGNAGSLLKDMFFLAGCSAFCAAAAVVATKVKARMKGRGGYHADLA